MKSVSFSEVVYANDLVRTRQPSTWRRLLPFWLLLGAGLLAIAVLMRMLDPDAPLAYIVLPVLAGGLLPVWALMPARFEATTRFEARHLVNTVEEALLALGYESVAGGPDALLYRARGGTWLRWPVREVSVTVRPHVLDIAGPAITLRALQKALSR